MRAPSSVLACLIAVFLFALLPEISCNHSGTKGHGGDSTETARSMVVPPDFNADSAYNWVAAQVAYGPRIPNTPPSTQCGNWLSAKLKQYCNQVEDEVTQVKIYNGQLVSCHNITASFNPENKKRILLFTHWDTRPWSDQDASEKQKTFDGADDGGSGTAILLELARILKDKPCGVGVDILLEDVEDYGPPYFEPGKWKEDDAYCLGTQYWCHAHEKKYNAYYGILLDMVGARDSKFYLEWSSMQYAPAVMQDIWNSARVAGFGSYFISQQTEHGVIDDHKYVNEILHIPAIDIIAMDLGSKTTFARHWHTQQDNMQVIDRATLKAVGQTLLQVLYNEPAAF